MKKLLCTVLAIMMVCGTLSFAAADVETYEVESVGNSTGMKLSVSFDGDKITDVTVLEHNETAGICDNAIARIPAAIVEANSVAIDTVAGATMTSRGIINGVKAAIEASGRSVADFEKAQEAAKAEDVTLDCDAVVVGAGFAGLAAANAMGAEGANVILIEKLAGIGGTSALSGGETLTDGTAESIPAMIEYWISRQNDFPAADQMDTEKMTYYLNELPATLSWLADDFGMKYNDDNVKSNPVRRPCGLDGRGAAVAQILGDKLAANGVTLMLETAAYELLTDENGTVVGVAANGANGENVTINAKAVVLTTGGFTKNAELMEKYAPEFAGFINTTAAGDNGDGLLMAEKLGAYVFEDALCVNNYGALKEDGSTIRATASGCLFVGMDGTRKCSEAEDRYYVSTAYLYTPEGPEFFSICDTAIAEANNLIEGIEGNLGQPTILKADTLEDLAAQMGVNAETFLATVQRYNELCATGKDTDFGKADKYMVAIAEEGPFYAVKNTEVLYSVMGGLKADTNGAVLNTEGAAIPGLYAAGAVCARDWYGKLYIGASMVAMSLNTGRLTGEYVASVVK